jgi:poly(glycerol-phosphate) alpha-glucosyltransferase
MTSSFEGYPLSTLESMSHCCPVIAYDIKYGPREQITHGIDGFLVRPGDIQGVARRIIQLLDNPELVRTMGEAARRKAEEHGTSRFIDDWNTVLRSAVALKPRRTSLRAVQADIELSVRAGAFARLRSLARRTAAVRDKHRRCLEVAALLTVHGSSQTSDLDDALFELAAIKPGAKVRTIPATVERREVGFMVRASVPLVQLCGPETESAGEADLRLRLIWQNSCWQEVLEHPPAGWQSLGSADRRLLHR